MTRKKSEPTPTPPVAPTFLVFSWSALLPVPGYPGWYIGPYFPTHPVGVMRFLTLMETVLVLPHGGFPHVSAIPAALFVLGLVWDRRRHCWKVSPCVYEYVTEPELSLRHRESTAYIHDMVAALGHHLSMDCVVSGPWRGGIDKSLPQGDGDA